MEEGTRRGEMEATSRRQKRQGNSFSSRASERNTATNPFQTSGLQTVGLITGCIKPLSLGQFVSAATENEHE